ncbi:Indigoidine synthase A like protein-domain-containing protein [Gorgonomyces haynaldii]|nr:Indigoidine synthase A like protein-domain-containing protein [Gorgonomyces haynaldii]
MIAPAAERVSKEQFMSKIALSRSLGVPQILYDLLEPALQLEPRLRKGLVTVSKNPMLYKTRVLNEQEHPSHCPGLDLEIPELHPDFDLDCIETETEPDLVDCQVFLNCVRYHSQVSFPLQLHSDLDLAQAINNTDLPLNVCALNLQEIEAHLKTLEPLNCALLNIRSPTKEAVDAVLNQASTIPWQLCIVAIWTQDPGFVQQLRCQRNVRYLIVSGTPLHVFGHPKPYLITPASHAHRRQEFVLLNEITGQSMDCLDQLCYMTVNYSLERLRQEFYKQFKEPKAIPDLEMDHTQEYRDFSEPKLLKHIRRLTTLLDISPRIKQALVAGKPVVALESTIITHGMPFPQNLETALELEDIVRKNGCEPATIALMDGRVKVGLEKKDLERLAQVGLEAIKTSRRDFAWVTAQKKIGATTVSGTMIAAHQAGIPVFVTGGIGGVHRNGHQTLDISADLTELGRTPVAVVCAGVKSILDIEKTLEFLETQGVTVATVGKDTEFPAFYTRKSANKQLGLESGMVFAVPIPEEDEISNPQALEDTISKAVQEAAQSGIKGKDITPFLLDKVKTLTKGESLKANIALVKNNAKIGSQIALELCRKYEAPGRPFIVGGTVLDVSAKANGVFDNVLKTSTPGHIQESLGGVGRNMAEACHRLGGNPLFFSVVGRDMAGNAILEQLQSFGMDTSCISQEDGNTARYNAFLDENGDLIGAVADMHIHALQQPNLVSDKLRALKPPVVALDGNLELDTLDAIITRCGIFKCPVLFEPTSVEKSCKALYVATPQAIQYLTPDKHEARHLADLLQSIPINARDIPQFHAFKESKDLITLLQVFETVVLKMGSNGVLVGTVRPQRSEKQDAIFEGQEIVEITRLEAQQVKVISKAISF